MKIITFYLFGILTFSVIPSAQSACWITCNTGTRSCHDLSPLGCKRAGDSLKYCAAAYAPGACPFNAVENLLSSPEAKELYEGSEDDGVVTFDKVESLISEKAE